MKFAVDRWAGSDGGARAAAFEAAFAVRQVEVGLASMVEIFSGLAVLLYGIALATSPLGARSLGLFGGVVGAAMLVSGVIKAHTGFSSPGMDASMLSSVSALLWTICIGIFLLRAQR